MANKTLINRKTGKEVEASDPEAVMKKYPRQFTVKPGTKLNAEVAKVENALLAKNLEDMEVDIDKISDSKDLKNLLKEEKAGKNRTGAVKSIQDRITFLKENISNPDGKAPTA